MITFKTVLQTGLLALGTLLPGAAFAASGVIRVNVPFKFVVAGTTLPAGQYNIQVSETGSVLYIQGQAANVMVESATISTGSTAEPALVFQTHNGANYLVSARMGDMSTRQLPVHTF